MTELRCRVCEREFELAPLSSCPACHGPLDVRYSLETFRPPANGPTSMWRYGELLPHAPAQLETPGLTPLVEAPRLSALLGIELLLKLEDANPTHSVKDRSAACAVAAAQAFGFETVCCASSGNLADAIAARCAAAGLEALVLCPADDHPLFPAPSLGAKVFLVRGSLDDCRALERDLGGLFPWGFVGGNLYPFASEGAKTIAYETAEQLGWELPDAVVCPVGSGMLLAKIAQGFNELAALGAVRGRHPRLYGAQAGGSQPLAAAWAEDRPHSRVHPDTAARSLAIGDPVEGELAVGAARASGGAILAVREEEIAHHAALLAEQAGVFSDLSGGVALGALFDLVQSGRVAPGERVVLVVTGSGLKPTARDVPATAREIEGDVGALLAALGLE